MDREGKYRKRVIFLVNPNAGSQSSRSAVGRLSTLLEERDFRIDVISDVDQMARAVSDASTTNQLKAVVAVGGDGTAELVANRTPVDTPITLLPMGTENLLAKYLGISNDPDQLCAAIESGKTIKLDAGQNGDRLFLIMLSCGFDAEVVRRLHGQRSGHINHLSYAKPIMDSMLNYDYPELRVTCRTQNENGTVTSDEIVSHWVFVFNLPSYAAGLGIVPDAVGTDGFLDVCTFQGGSVWHGLYHLSAIMLGQHRQWSDCETRRVTSVRIESDGKVPYQVDGDPGGYLPVEARIVPQRLTFIVPEDWGK